MSEVRDISSLSIHPEAQIVPRPDAGDRRSLRDSLADEGQQDPIDVTPAGVVLDGRTRLELLRELGAETVQVRVVDIPESAQAHYIVERALTRRHLSMLQKKALNDLLRVQVVEERPTKRGTVMRIGHSQTERAAKLAVDVATVQRWDSQAPLVTADAVTRTLPTHAIDQRGRPQPLHKEQPAQRAPRQVVRRDQPEPLRKARPIPSWSRLVSLWLRNSARPEDRDYLRRLDREIHAALDANGVACTMNEGSN